MAAYHNRFHAADTFVIGTAVAPEAEPAKEVQPSGHEKGNDTTAGLSMLEDSKTGEKSDEQKNEPNQSNDVTLNVAVDIEKPAEKSTDVLGKQFSATA